MRQTTPESLCRGASEILERVINTADVESRLEPHDFESALPESLVSDEPGSLVVVQLFGQPHSLIMPRTAQRR